MTRDEAVHRHHVQCRGTGEAPLVLAHGFGCNQQTWRFITPAFEDSHRVVLFDHIGFELQDIEGLAQMRDRNLVGWADYLSLTAAGGGDERSVHAAELKASLCATDPDILKRFAAATFLGDNRADLSRVTVPSLVLQVERDAIAPLAVGRFCAEQMKGSQLVVMPVVGHCPHLAHPQETISAIRHYLGS